MTTVTAYAIGKTGFGVGVAPDAPGEATPKGRAARFAFDGKIVAEFLRERAEFPILQRHHRLLLRWERSEIPAASRKTVLALVDHYGLTERQLRDWSRRRRKTVVLWDRRPNKHGRGKG